MSIYKKEFSKQQLEQIIGELEAQLIDKKESENKAKRTDPNAKIECDLCGGSYSSANAAVHRRTKKHMKEEEHLKQLKRILRARTIEGRSKI